MAADRDFEQSIYNHQQAQAPAGSLFETYADRVLRHVDNLLAGRDCPWPLSEAQKDILSLLRIHRGKEKAVPLTRLASFLNLDARAIKGLIEDLRHDFRVPIGANRMQGGGYYLISNDEESRESSQYLVRQAVSMLRTAHIMRPSQTVAELAGQVRLALESQPTAEKETTHV